MLLAAERELFGIDRYAILVDRSVDPALIEPLVGDGLAGLFTFGIDLEGERLHGRPIGVLDRVAALPDCRGWIVATESRACYALNHLLHDAGREREVILTLATRRLSRIFSYVDFFKGETRTQAWVHNLFERAYKIPYPLALRYVVRSHDGRAMLASQKLIPAAHTIVFDSDDMDLPEPFAGYLELYADVRHLDGDVSPFLHLNCDYVSANAVTTVHQSGYSPWPAGSRFARGLVPKDPERRLTVSLYNRVNPEPIVPTAELRATLDGRRVSVVRELPPVPQGHMTFTDLNGVFAPELAAGATAADVVIAADKNMHRPNFYVRPARSTWSWESVEHSDGRADSVVPCERRAFLRRAGVHPWICPVPLLPDEQQIDTWLHYLQEGAAKLHLFRMRAYDGGGRCALDTDLRLDFGESLNVTEWVKQNAADPTIGLVTLTASDRAPQIPDSYQIIGGFTSRRGPSPPVTQLAGVSAANLPVDVEQTAHWRLPVQQSMLHVIPTEIFGKARVGPEYDTTVVLYNPSAADRYARTAHLELDVVTWDGRSTRFYRSIPPNGSVAFSVSALIDDAHIRSDRDYFTLWAYCRDCFVSGYHIIRRKADDALGVEHFYYPRFPSKE